VGGGGRPLVSRIAFLFPGQGSQAVGMGRSLAERYPEAREVFEEVALAESFPAFLTLVAQRYID